MSQIFIPFLFSFGIKNCLSGNLMKKTLIKKTLVVIKSIAKARDHGDEVENEVINAEILNSETFFSQAFRKFSSFLLVLDLMHEL